MTGEKKGRSLVPVVVVSVAVLGAGALLLLRMRVEPPTVPPYALGEDDGGAAVLRAGQLFRMVAAPKGIVTGAVGARGFLVRGNEVRPWEPVFAVDRDGTIHVEGAVETLFAGVPPGPWDVAVAVGRPETLPTAPRDILLARDAGGADAAWCVVREHIVLGG